MTKQAGWMCCTLAIWAVACGDSGTGGDGQGGDGQGGDQGGQTAEGGSGGEGCVVDTTYDPIIDPADFAGTVDHPLFPLVPGTVFTFSEGEETIVVTVLAEKKTILGVTCTVVHDQSSDEDGILEDTLDYYAQGLDGTVWYFGEETAEYEGGEVVSTEGSWEAGVDGARPGVIIPGDLVVGQQYRQEYYACHAEDMAEIVDVDVEVTVPFGSFTQCLLTRDTNPLEPEVEENKTYCPEVGLVLAVEVNSGVREELTTVDPP